MEVVLTIAGSDSSAGAGVQQDMKTVTAMGHYCATVITAITAQNTLGVQQVMPVPPEILRAQLVSVLSDMPVAAVKTGMIPNSDSAKVIVDVLRSVKCPVVCDPVMISTSGTPLMSDDCIDLISKELFPLCTLVTPNIPEAERLGLPQNAKNKYSVLLKGGHADGREMTDKLIMQNGLEYLFTSPRIETKNLHGTGCTLSSAIAVGLAEGKDLTEAVRLGKQMIDRGIEGGKDLHIGKGNGPLWFV